MSTMPNKPKLTRKQRVFVNEIIANPKISGTEAAMKAYGKPDKPVSKNVAHSIASENLRKPAVMAFLHDKASEAEQAVYEVMNVGLSKAKTNPAYGGLALSASRDILDRVHGKATQNVEVKSTVLNLSIDLSGMSLSDEVIEG